MSKIISFDILPNEIISMIYTEHYKLKSQYFSEINKEILKQVEPASICLASQISEKVDEYIVDDILFFSKTKNKFFRWKSKDKYIENIFDKLKNNTHNVTARELFFDINTITIDKLLQTILGWEEILLLISSELFADHIFDFIKKLRKSIKTQEYFLVGKVI